MFEVSPFTSIQKSDPVLFCCIVAMVAVINVFTLDVGLAILPASSKVECVFFSCWCMTEASQSVLPVRALSPFHLQLLRLILVLRYLRSRPSAIERSL